jgi:hypothetical protein
MTTVFMIQALNLPLWKCWLSINSLKEKCKKIDPNTSYTLFPYMIDVDYVILGMKLILGR